LRQQAPNVGTGIQCEIQPIQDVELVKAMWLELQADANGSYFLSWNWIGTWLDQLPSSTCPLLFIARDQDRVAGLAILVSRALYRHGFVRSHAVFINKTGDDELDEITIEYNGVLAKLENRARVTRAAIDFLIAEGWDEVFLDAYEATPDWPLRGTHWKAQIRKSWPVFGVDLDRLKSDGIDFSQSLGRSTRYQLRHAVRAYESLGEMHVEVAATKQNAEFYFSELQRMHQAYWTDKGHRGAFANAALIRFHRALVANRFDSGEIQLIRIAFGGHTVGYLYNFGWNGSVLNYQSGLDYSLLPQTNRPGLVAHWAAIEHNASKGNRYYDFLGGDSQHKRVMSNHASALDFMVARRTCLKFRLEDALRSLWKYARRHALGRPKS